MALVLLGLAALSLATWVHLAFARGGFWRADQILEPAGELAAWPAVVAVIPARNEAPTIGRTVSSLLDQDYPGEFSVIVVDDGSDDGTREAAGETAGLRVVDGTALEPGWSGKLWAVQRGLEAAGETAADATYVLFTDADIDHDPHNLRKLVFKAETDDRVLVSLMVRLRCRSEWERLLIPAFVYFFQKLYPFPRVNDPDRPEAAAAGGCMLVRREALAAAGGIEAIKDRIIDDCAMGALLKGQGRIWLGLTTETISRRAYDRLSEIWNMVARTAFVQLDHSGVLLAGTVLGMMILYVVPPAIAAIGYTLGSYPLALIGVFSWALMCMTFTPTLRLYGEPTWRGLLLPVAAVLYTLMTISSAWRHWFGSGAEWKGRRYPKTGPGDT